MLEGKRCFLEKPEWLTVPWAKCPSAKSPWDHLIDIFCALPGLVEDQRFLAALKASMSASQPGDPDNTPNFLEAEYRSAAVALHETCCTHLRQLHAWKRTWDATSSPPSTMPVSLALFACPAYPPAVFGPALVFRNLPHASEYTTYNIILLSLLGLLSEAGYESSPTSTKDDDLDSSPLLESPNSNKPPGMEEVLLKRRNQAALEICRSAPYHLLPGLHGCGGAYLIMARLCFALPVFRPGSIEMKCVAGILQYVVEKWGFGMGFSVVGGNGRGPE